MGKDKLSAFLIPSPRLVPQGLNPTCQEIVTVERTFVSNKSNGKNVVAPDNNRRISGMLKVCPKNSLVVKEREIYELYFSETK